MDLPFFPECIANCLRQFCEDVSWGIVDNRVGRIETQAVEMVFGKPVQSVVNKEIPHGPALSTIEIDRAAPRRAMAVGKKLRRINAQIISFRTEVVVNNVQKNH